MCSGRVECNGVGVQSDVYVHVHVGCIVHTVHTVQRTGAYAAAPRITATVQSCTRPHICTRLLTYMAAYLTVTSTIPGTIPGIMPSTTGDGSNKRACPEDDTIDDRYEYNTIHDNYLSAPSTSRKFPPPRAPANRALVRSGAYPSFPQVHS